jgi:hypothetical protein
MGSSGSDEGDDRAAVAGTDADAAVAAFSADERDCGLDGEAVVLTVTEPGKRRYAIPLAIGVNPAKRKIDHQMDSLS